MSPLRVIVCSAFFGIGLWAPPPVDAGGGGQNLLLIVNPNDENSLRVANAYQSLRAIPESHVLFYDPPNSVGLDRIVISEAQALDFLQQVEQAITARGLAGQIDYFGLVGVPFRMSGVTGTTNQFTRNQSMGHSLMQLTQYRAGTPPVDLGRHLSGLYEGTTHTNPSGQLNYVAGSNAAIHHSQVYTVGADDFQYFMSGQVGPTWQWGMTADEAIANLTSSRASDGTRPAGTIYFEENDNVRSNTREFQWPAVQAEFTLRGLPWIEERNVPGATPLNRSDVRGAVVGSANPVLPNGSTYLPGSWADSLTSTAGNFTSANQVKAVEFLQAGAGASSGSVVEPYAISNRFPDAAIFLFIEDGSTLGEAYFKSMAEPTVLNFMGDLLAQPYADVPVVSITSGPADGATVSGSIAVDAGGALSAPVIATAVSEVELYVDGLLSQTIAGASGTFNIDTTTLDDGRHEFRFVAVNDAMAASEGYLLRHYVVDNDGRSVAAPGGNVVAADTGVVSVAVQAVAGGGTVSSIELRHLGRVLGSVAGASGNINVSASGLAYGDNPIVPVAIYSDGQEVAAAPFTFTRNTTIHAGGPVTPPGSRTAGVRMEYFIGKGGASIAASDFSGTPEVVETYDRALVAHPLGSGIGGAGGNLRGNAVRSHPALIPVDDLCFRVEGSFEVPVGEAGEYGFMLYRCNDSAQLSIDGVNVMSYNNSSSGASSVANAQGMIYLGEGEHTLEYLAANRVTSTTSSNRNFFDFALWMRGPGGKTELIDDSFLYSLAPANPMTPPDLMDASDSGASNTDDITNDDTPTFTGMAPPGTAVSLTAGPIGGAASVVGSATADGSGVWTITTSVLAEGSYLVRATDGAALESSGILVLIDRTVATPSGLDLIDGSDRGVSNSDDLTNDSTPSITMIADAGDMIEVTSSLDGIVASQSDPAANPTITTDALSEGIHLLTATAGDLAGNTSPPSAALTIEIDLTLPAAPTNFVLDPASDSGISNTDLITNVTTPICTMTIDADATVDVYVFPAPGLVGSGAGPNVMITTAALGDGILTIYGIARDPAGNSSLFTLLTTITVDTMAPGVTVEQGAGQADPATGGAVSFDVTFDEDVSGFEAADVTIGGSAAAGTSAGVSGADPGAVYGLSVSGMSWDGTIIATVSAGGVTDIAGNANAASTSADNVVDWMVPVPAWPGVLLRPGASGSTFKWSTDLGVDYKVQYSDDLVNWVDVLPPVPGTMAAEEFVDDGPPKTVSHPSSVPRRYYRVLRLP